MAKTKRRFKKSLAVLLAAVLALSSMWGITAFAATDSEVSILYARITDYENKMDTVAQDMAEGKLYVNLKDAYDAYIEAKAVYDAYTYGQNHEVDATTAASALATATDAITLWQDDGTLEFDATAYHVNEVATDGYSNLAWTSGIDSTVWSGSAVDTNNYSSFNRFSSKIAMQDATIYVYDGVNDTYSPIVYEVVPEQNSFRGACYVVYAVYPCDGEGWSTIKDGAAQESAESTTDYASTMALKENWLGYTHGDQTLNDVGGNNAGYLIWPGDYATAEEHIAEIGYARDHSLSSLADEDQYNIYFRQYGTSFNNPSSSSNGYNKASASSNHSNSTYWWNKLYYVGEGQEPEMTTQYYTGMENIEFILDHYILYHDNMSMFAEDSERYGNHAGTYSSGEQWIINYEPIKSNLDTYAETISTALIEAKGDGLNAGISYFLEGQLDGILADLDYFTGNDALNPMDSRYDYDTAYASGNVETEVAKCATQISVAANSDHADNEYDIQVDNNGYNWLIAEMVDYRDAAGIIATENATDDGDMIFTSTSYSAFVAAYNDAVAFLADLEKEDTGYDYFQDYSAAQTLAEALYDAAHALKLEYDHHHTAEELANGYLTITTSAIDPTCTTVGRKAIYTCSDCNLSYILNDAYDPDPYFDEEEALAGDGIPENEQEYVRYTEYSQATIDALGHEYSDDKDGDDYKYITFDWNESTINDANLESEEDIVCFATFTCDVCGVESEQKICDVTVNNYTAASCETAGSYQLTASASIDSRDDATITGTNTISDDLAATGHDWFNEQFTWSSDYSTCTFSAECLNDEEHNITNQPCTVEESSTEATCTEPAATVYTATYTYESENGAEYNETFTDVKTVETASANGHSWNADTLDYMWDSNNNCLIMVQCSECKEYAGTFLELDETQEFGTTGYVTTETVDATCEEDGTITYKAVGQIIDPFTEEPITLTIDDEEVSTFTDSREETISAGDGTHQLETEKIEGSGIAATCETAGIAEIFQCSVCGNLYVENEDGTYTQVSGVEDEAAAIPATGHTLAETPVYTKAATCTEPGYEYYACVSCSCGDECQCNKNTIPDENEEPIKDASGEIIYYCEAVEIPATGNHSYGKPEYTWVADKDGATCTATMTCENCGAVITAGDCTITSEVTKEATCTDTGTITYTAKVDFALNDGDSYVQPLASMVTYETTTDVEIPALGHDWPETSDSSYFEWTVTDEGATCTVTVPCSRCDEELTEENVTVTPNYEDGNIVSYTASIAFYDDSGNKVAGPYSDTYVVEAEEPEHVHDYDYANATFWWQNESTCYAEVECKICGESDFIPCTVTAGETTTATCVAPGTSSYTASFTIGDVPYTCETPYVVTTEINPTNHGDNISLTPAVEATCAESGNIAYWHCTACGKFFADVEGVVGTEIEESSIATEIVSTNHSWPENASFAWTADAESATCTVTITCENDPNHTTTESLTLDNGITKDESDPSKVVYTASVQLSYNDTVIGTYTDTYVVEIEEPEHEHTYEDENVEFLWDLDKDEPICIAILYCDDYADETDPCGGYMVVECTVVPVDTPATCTTAGYTTYTASATFEGISGTFTDTRTEAGDPATGHTWGSVSTGINQNNHSGTAMATCSVCKKLASQIYSYDSEAEPGTLNCVTSYEIDPTCAEYGYTVYELYCNLTDPDTGEYIVADKDGVPTATFYAVIYIQISKLPHENIEYVSGVPASCFEDGVRAHYECTDCGSAFTDKEGTIPVNQDSLVIPAAGQHTIGPVEAKNATCMEDGNSAYYKCSVCGAVFADEDGTEEASEEDFVISAHGHTWKEFTVASTCTEAGHYYYYCACGDEDNADDECCTECACNTSKATYIDENGVEQTIAYIWSVDLPLAAHTFDYAVANETSDENKAATCTEPGAQVYDLYCSVCEKIYDSFTVTLDPLGHEYGDGVVTKAATCKTDGEKTFTCTRCDDYYTETIEAAGHTIDYDSPVYTVAATCTTDGMAYYQCKCTDCGDTCNCNSETVTDADNDEITYNYCETVEIPATGHGELNYVEAEDATCTEDGNIGYWQCDTCGAMFSEPYAHENDALTEKDIVVKALGHAWTNDPVFTWSDDYTSCTATITCANDENHTLTDENCKVSSTTDPEGNTTYTATATFTEDNEGNEIDPPLTYTDTYVVEAPEPEHTHSYDYDNITYWWTDEETCYAEVKCVSDDGVDCDAPELFYECTVAEPTVVAATCTSAGSETYTATFVANGKTYTSTEYVVIIPIDDEAHAYGEPVFNWADDYSECTAIFTCTYDSTHIHEQDCALAYYSTADGTTYYSATVTLRDSEGNQIGYYTDEKVVYAEEEHVHSYKEEDVEFLWNFANEYCIVVAPCSGCDEYMTKLVQFNYDLEEATVNEVFYEELEPTCTEPGYSIYIVSVQFYDEDGNAIEFTYITDEGDEDTTDNVGQILYVETLPALGHTEGEKEYDEDSYVAPTETEDGSVDWVIKCTVCGEVLDSGTEIIPATGTTEPGEGGDTGDEPGEGGDTGDEPGEGGDTGDEPGEGGDTGDEPGEGGDTGEEPGEGGDTGDEPGEGTETEDEGNTPSDESKQDLEDKTSDAESLLDNEDLSDETKQNLQDAIDNAKDVLDDPDSTQEDIDKALEDLQDAIDKAQQEIEDAQSGSGDEGKPGEGGETETPSTGTETETPSTGTETETPTTAEDLTQAADDAQSALDAATEAGVDESLIKDLEDAIANAEAVLADENATQEDIDAAMEALQAALDAVNNAMNAAGASTSTSTSATELVEVEVVDPETGEHYIVYLDPETGIYYADAEGTEVVDEESFILAEDYDEGEDEDEDLDEEDEEDEDEENEEEAGVNTNESSIAPQTGASLAALATTMAIAAAGIVVVSRKKKEEE